MPKLIELGDKRLNEIVFRIYEEAPVFDKDNDARIPGILIRSQEFSLSAPYTISMDKSNKSEYRLVNDDTKFGHGTFWSPWPDMTPKEVASLVETYLTGQCPKLITIVFRTLRSRYYAEHKMVDGQLHNAFLAEGFLYKAITH